MFKVRFIAFILMPFVFTNCKKADNASAKNLTITGIQDVTINPFIVGFLSLTVSAVAKDSVMLSATGLPAGIGVVFNPSGGTPTFNASATFKLTGPTVAGTYPVKIVGSSASYTEAYDLKITVPPFNGWTVDGQPFWSGGIWDTVVSNSGLMSVYAPMGYAQLIFNKTGGFPKVDGTYTYEVGNPANTNDVLITFREDPTHGSHEYYSFGPTLTTLTMVKSNGKRTIILPTTRLSDVSSATRDLAINLTE